MLRGYARVSIDEQDTVARVAALKAAGCKRIYREKASGDGAIGPPSSCPSINFAMAIWSWCVKWYVKWTGWPTHSATCLFHGAACRDESEFRTSRQAGKDQLLKTGTVAIRKAHLPA